MAEIRSNTLLESRPASQARPHPGGGLSFAKTKTGPMVLQPDAP